MRELDAVKIIIIREELNTHSRPHPRKKHVTFSS